MGSRPKWPMSAYIASPPVTARNTAPSTPKLIRSGACRSKPRAYSGLAAARTPGARNPAQAEDREHQEPDQHHRTEDAADEGCSLPLDEEENRQDDDRDRHDQRGAFRGVASDPDYADRSLLPQGEEEPRHRG